MAKSKLNNTRKIGDIVVRKCTGSCGLELELCKENFSWRNDSGDWHTQCIFCLKQQRKIFRENNKEKIHAEKKKYREINKEKIALKKKNDYKKNEEKIKEKRKQDRINNSEAIRQKEREYYNNHKEKISEHNKKFNEKNKEKNRERASKYYYENKEKINEGAREKRKNLTDEERKKQAEYKKEWKKQKLINDPIYKLRENVSHLIYMYLTGNSSGKYGKSSINCLPYTIEELKTHIESLFEPWMNWNNQGVYRVDLWNDNDPSTWKWQLDHIIPHSSIKYESLDDEKFKKAWALENLRPLSAKQNLLDGVRGTRHIKNKKAA